MNKVTIRQRILSSFALILVSMLSVGGVAFQRFLQVEEKAAFLQKDSIPGLYFAGQIRGTWKSNYSVLQTAVIANGTVPTNVTEEQLRANRSHMDAMIKGYWATITLAEDLEQLKAFDQARGPFFALQSEVLQLLKEGKSEEARIFMRTRLEPAFQGPLAMCDTIVEFNRKTSEAAGESIVNVVAAAKSAIGLSFVVALVLMVAAGFFLLNAITQPLAELANGAQIMATGDFSHRMNWVRKDEFGALANSHDRMGADLATLVGQVQTSGIQVNSSVNQLTATLREQQATATEIAATTTEIGATSREITATSKELVRTMGTVASSTEEAAALAGKGQAGLVQMGETMRRVMEATSSINSKLAVLNEKAGNINQVVTTITKVADQTNLLSLNAAIEAEKAGEYGRGFSVVATEIRRLADQTALATLDIEQMVRDIQSAVSAGVMGMDKFSEEVRRGTQEVQQVVGQLSQVILNVQAQAPRFEAVSEGVQAQATGAEQITHALTQLGEAAQQTVDALRQSNQAIDELHHVTVGLREGVSKFKLKAATSALS